MTDKWKKAFLVLSSIFFTLILGELLLQLTFRIKNDRWLWENSAFSVDYIQPTDDRRQYSLRPSFYDHEQNMPINQWGERLTVQPVKREDSHAVIVCLGDSVPFGAGIGNEDTYPFYLAQTLSDNGFNYYVINGGVPSYNIRQSFDRLELEIFKNTNAEDVKVITLQVANDISLLAYYRENWTSELTWADVRFNIRQIPFSNQLAIPHYISQLLSQPKGKDKDFSSSIMTETIAQMLDEEIKKIQAASPDISIVLLPINPFYYYSENTDKNEKLRLWDVNSNIVKSWDALIHEFNMVFYQASTKNDAVYYFDVRTEMDKMDREILYVDYIHLSPEGSKLQARLVSEFLERNHLIY